MYKVVSNGINQMLFIKFKFTFVFWKPKKNTLNNYDNIGKCLLSVCLNDKLNIVYQYFLHLSDGTSEIKPMISYQNDF